MVGGGEDKMGCTPVVRRRRRRASECRDALIDP